MNPLQISVEEKDGITLINLSGTAQALNKQSEEVAEIRRVFKEIGEKEGVKAALNLTRVDYLASNTIGALLSGNSIIKKAGGKLVMYGASEYLKGIFDIVQLEQVLPLYDNYERALEELNKV